jgi:hypothetical protein
MGKLVEFLVKVAPMKPEEQHTKDLSFVLEMPYVGKL